MIRQRTIKNIIRATGVGLHTGEKVTLTVHPAPPGHGRKFRRMDLADEPVIEANIEHLKTVERAMSPTLRLPR